MSIWGRSLPLVCALIAGLVMPAHAQPSGTISVAASEAVLAPGQAAASVKVNWSTGASPSVRVYIQEDGKARKLWTEAAATASDVWNYLYADTTTRFELWGGSNFGTLLAATQSTGRAPGSLSADRTRLTVPPDRPGTITLSWSATTSDAQVWVSHNGGPQKLYAQGRSGRGTINWISRGTTVFTLWSGTTQEHLLDTLVVTADSGATASADTPVVVDPDGTGSATVRWSGGEARLLNDDGTETTLSGNGIATISTRGGDRKLVRVYDGTSVVAHTSVTVLRDPRGLAGFNYLPEPDKRYQEYLDAAVWPQVREQVARDFDVIAATGATLARIVLWPEKSDYFSGPAPCTATSSQRWCAQSRNLVDLARLAKERGIRLVPVFANSYLTGTWWAKWPGDADSRKKWAEFGVRSAEWMNVYINAVESSDARDAVLYYDLQNETSGVRGERPNLQSAYVAMVYDRTAAPRGKRGVSVLHAAKDGADLADALVGKPVDFVDVHAYESLDLIGPAVRGLRARFPSSTVLVGEVGKPTWKDGKTNPDRETEQAAYTTRTLDALAGERVPIALAWELYDDPQSPPHPLSTGYGYLAGNRAKPGYGVLCSRWSLVPDCGAPREKTAPAPTTLSVSTRIPVRPGGVLTPNAVLRGNGTVRLVVTEFDAAGAELGRTETGAVAIGGEELNYLRRNASDVRLRAETTSVSIAVVADGATRLAVTALTAGQR